MMGGGGDRVVRGKWEYWKWIIAIIALLLL